MARKVTDGVSVRVNVPASTTVVQGDFYQAEGFLGMAIQGVVNGAGVTAPIILDIEECEYETSQILTTDAFAKGALVYWDNTNRRFTITATANRLAGIVTVAKDGNNVIWFKLGPQV